MRAVINPEWAAEITEADIMAFNPEHGQEFLKTFTDLRTLGGFSLFAYGTQSGEGTTVYGAHEQRDLWPSRTYLNLALGRPAIVAMPLFDRRGDKGQETPLAVEQFMDYFMAAEHKDYVLTTEKVLLPVSGVELIDTTRA